MTVQAGAYGEHRFGTVTAGGKTTPVNGPSVTVRLSPGAGERLQFSVQRYANEATLRLPWDAVRTQ